MVLTDRTILVTGGTSGIGRGLAEALHRQGNRVIIAGRRQNILDEVAAANPGMRGLRVDMRDADCIARGARDLVAIAPELDVLINNAGISRAEAWDRPEVDIDAALAMIETNVTGTLRMTAALLPALLSRAAATIVTTTSGLAFVPRANFATYCASKAFLHSWLQSLRHQLRHTKVDVLELPLPDVQTELAGPEQQRDPAAMPLAEYIEEAIALLGGPDPTDGEILVERVKALRLAERRGFYQEVYDRLNP